MWTQHGGDWSCFCSTCRARKMVEGVLTALQRRGSRISTFVRSNCNPRQCGHLGVHPAVPSGVAEKVQRFGATRNSVRHHSDAKPSLPSRFYRGLDASVLFCGKGYCRHRRCRRRGGPIGGTRKRRKKLTPGTTTATLSQLSLNRMAYRSG